MNVKGPYKVDRPIIYQKKCYFCKSIISIPYSKMNFNGPTFARCVCGHEVQFTDDLGCIPTNVSFIYGKGDLND